MPCVYRFGPFELDEASGELRRRGFLLHVQAQPRRLLAMLLARRGVVVTRDEMRAELWGTDVHVDYDRGLHFAIAHLRRVLGDEARHARYIETVPRCGYRFVGTVERVASAPRSRARPERSARLGRCGLAALVLLIQAPAQPNPPPGSPPSRARGAYLAALHHRAEGRPEEALRWLEQAVGQDPSFAPAQATLAGLEVQLARSGAPAVPALLRAREAAEAALRADPTSPEAHLALGEIRLHLDWDWEGAGRELRQVVALRPDSAAWAALAAYHSARGEHAEAIVAVERSLDGDPACRLAHADAGWYYYVAGRGGEAERLWRASVAMDPRMGEAREGLFRLYLESGRWEAAVGEAQGILRAVGFSEDGISGLRLGSPRDAVERYLRGTVAFAASAAGRYLPAPRIAAFDAVLGEDEAALDLLEQAAEQRSPWLLRHLAVDPCLARLAPSRRYRRLLSRVGLSAAFGSAITG